ncbi:glycosyltransferase [Glycomyces buryatensis]|uniref:Glycosyltransferase family 4 protein n=1 Tax=Glycomyces buryatensis TaxID=2570927 RepID=A0A4S8QFJ5_9ACTN|nr:glycosyltransferase [Glycomyces buryatensis]THV43393.1 glycosyltransferase family 4 protein [Glycomyces buryatensis]
MGTASRGRVVMLVQNGVEGDSRVQKQAASMAAAGWDVTLLGRSPNGEVQTWDLGGAEVRLIHVRRAFKRRRHELRSHWARDPLAYPFGPIQIYRERQLEAWRAEIGIRKARIAIDAKHQSGAVTRLRKAALVPRRAAVRAAGTWADVRSAHTERLCERREAMDGRVDAFAIKFWKTVLGDRSWRRLDPALWDLELSFGPVLDRLEADLIHANDFQMIGVGARSVIRRRARGARVKLVWDVHEYLPGIKSWIDHPAWKDAQMAHEREYAPWADAVVTVSDTLADLLMERHGLAERPEVVMNVPDLDSRPEADDPVPDIRELCGIGPSAPLMVYSGAPMARRGLMTMVEALPDLEGVHAAFVVAKPEWADIRSLVARSEELGVADRVHLLPYVPHWQIVPFLAGADIGVIPIHHYLNHEIALITKFFEYSHARLPILVSDVKTMAAKVNETGQGEVFRAKDTADFVRAAKLILADPESYRKRYDTHVPLTEWTWPSQAAILDRVYTEALR